MVNHSGRERWEAVYRKTEYKVMLPSQTIILSIGRYDEEADRLLQAEAGLKKEWFIITPCNPRSELARQELNIFYFNELRYEVESRAGQWIQALNCDPDAQWPDEPGFLITDADRLWIMELGERFYQNALVTGKVGEAPRLLWLNN